MNEEELTDKTFAERYDKYYPCSNLSAKEIDVIVRNEKSWKGLINKLTIQDMKECVYSEDINYWKCFHARRYLWAKIRDDKIMMQEIEEIN